MLRNLLIISVVIFGWSSHCFAVGSTSFRLEILDSEANAKGNAFVAEADNASAVYYNPAAMTKLKDRTIASFGITGMRPFNEYEPAAGDEVQMVGETFMIPHSFIVHDFGRDDMVFGIGSYSSWGTATEWNPDSFARYVSTRSELTNIDSTIAVGFDITDELSMGFGLDYAYSRVAKSKKLLQSGGPDGDFQLKADAAGWAYRISTHYTLNEQHQFGLQYRSIMDVTYKGKAFAHGLNEFGLSYVTIFGADNYEANVKSDFTFPQSVVLGYSYQPNDRWVFNFDVEWMDWSVVEQEFVEFESETDPTRLAILNDGNPAARDWEDSFSYGVGGEFKANDKLRLRCGYTFKESSIPEENFSTIQPDFNVHGISVGYGYDFTDKLTMDMAYTAWLSSRDINNTVGNSVGADIDGEYSTFFNVLMATIHYNF